jgi:hypothetical protein
MSSPGLPPAILYVFGLIIAVMGGMRAYHLGWRRRPEGAEGEEAAADETGGDDASEVAPTAPESGKGGWARAKGGGYKRHIAMGLLWVAMGLFLIISTALNTR